VATECSWNDGSKTQYYVVILDQLQDHSGGVERALESRIRGPLTPCLVDPLGSCILSSQISVCRSSKGYGGNLALDVQLEALVEFYLQGLGVCVSGV